MQGWALRCELARPAGTSCCATNVPGTGWIYGGLVPHVAFILSSGSWHFVFRIPHGDEEDETVAQHFGQE